MVQLHSARFTPDTIHSNEVSYSLLCAKHHLTVLPVVTAVIVAGHFCYGIPTCPAPYLVDCQDGVKITLVRAYLGRATLIRCECRPCGSTTRGTGMIGLTRILGRTRGAVNRCTAKRELTRFFLDIP